jgi:probable HAF family extracellular repeat protein
VGNYRAMVWTRSQGIQNLNHLIGAASSEWILAEARGVNAAGQIVGVGIHDGQERAFLLSPTGEEDEDSRGRASRRSLTAP